MKTVVSVGVDDTLLVVDKGGEDAVDWTRLAPSVAVVQNATEAVALIEERAPAVVVAGAYALMPDGRSLLAHVAERWPEIVRVVAAPRGHAPSAIHVINEAGVFGYIELPPSPESAEELLGRALDHASRIRRQSATIDELRGALSRMEDQIAMVEAQSIAGQAQIDPDTGLWTRPHLIERIEDESNRLARYGIPFGAVLLDLSKPTAELESAAAELLMDFVRKVDVAGRLEPGRFIVICPNTNDEGMQRVLVRMSEAFAAAALSGTSGDQSPVCIATCALTEAPAPSDEVLFRLNTALAAALQSPDRRAHFTSE